MRAAAAAAPKPLSMFTTTTPRSEHAVQPACPLAAAP
jgi:hypothetical protein